MRETARIASTTDRDLAETLRAMVRAHALWILRHPQHFAVLDRDERHLPQRVQSVQKKGKRELVDTFGALIRRGTASGRFREIDPAVTALCIFGMCGWTVRWFKPSGRLSEEQVADAIADLAVSMVQRPPWKDIHAAGNASSWLTVLKDDIAHLERALARSPSHPVE